MFNNIKSKLLGVRIRSLLLVFLLIVSMFSIVACDNKEDVVTTQEFELVSCYIEYRNETNWMGGIIKTEEYFHYGYVDDNGQVIFDEMYFEYLDLKVTEGTSKVIITTSKSKTTYTFELTREMYNNLKPSQN